MVGEVYRLDISIQIFQSEVNIFAGRVFVAVRRCLCAVQKAYKRFDVSVNPINYQRFATGSEESGSKAVAHSVLLRIPPTAGLNLLTPPLAAVLGHDGFIENKNVRVRTVFLASIYHRRSPYRESHFRYILSCSSTHLAAHRLAHPYIGRNVGTLRPERV